ncbi:MAG TPA: NADH-quinone oxidoreductase subunit H [Anaerolineales bacterium]|nr:NADH-quinone oxidoreductase subunit H [Anaerolineales bacterium]
MTNASLVTIGILQALLIAALAPLFSGFARVLRAKMHSRHGPPLLQNYYDLFKLVKRQEIVPAQASLLFRITPYLSIAAILLAVTIIPILTVQSPFGWVGDMILVVYLLVLVRFFTSLAGLGSGSTFGGMAARRELLISTLIEPLILLVLFVMALLAGSTNLGVISGAVATGELPYNATVWLGMIAFAFVVFIEAGKLPFDLAEAEQELQEGPLTEYSGRGLALMKWGLYMKQLAVVALFVAVFLPFGSMVDVSPGAFVVALLLFIIKAAVLYLVAAVVENGMARVRFIKAPSVTWIAVGIGLLCFAFYLVRI